MDTCPESFQMTPQNLRYNSYMGSTTINKIAIFDLEFSTGIGIPINACYKTNDI